MEAYTERDLLTLMDVIQLERQLVQQFTQPYIELPLFNNVGNTFFERCCVTDMGIVFNQLNEHEYSKPELIRFELCHRLWETDQIHLERWFRALFLQSEFKTTKTFARRELEQKEKKQFKSVTSSSRQFSISYMSDSFPVVKQWFDFLEDVAAERITVSVSGDNAQEVALRINFLDEGQKAEIVRELLQFVNCTETELNNAIEGRLKNVKLGITCQQNQFAEVFKRLKYNGRITQTDKQIIEWLENNFQRPEKSGSPDLGKRTLEDLFKPSGKHPRERICEFDWLEYKTADQLIKDAAAEFG